MTAAHCLSLLAAEEAVLYPLVRHGVVEFAAGLAQRALGTILYNEACAAESASSSPSSAASPRSERSRAPTPLNEPPSSQLALSLLQHLSIFFKQLFRYPLIFAPHVRLPLLSPERSSRDEPVADAGAAVPVALSSGSLSSLPSSSGSGLIAVLLRHKNFPAALNFTAVLNQSKDVASEHAALGAGPAGQGGKGAAGPEQRLHSPNV